MTDVVVVGVLEAEVILLDDVHLVVHLLHQLLPRRFLLQRKDDELKVKTITQRFFLRWKEGGQGMVNGIEKEEYVVGCLWKS